MKTFKNITLFIVITFILLQSCCIIDKVKEEIPECQEVENVHSMINMDIFKGFVDNMSVRDLINTHGRPSLILDAEEVASVEGYIIYEYNFPDGDIDCYIKQGVNESKAIVEYIYYEPKSNIKLKDIVINDSLCNILRNSQANVHYIGNKFYDIVRIRLNDKNKDEITNIALNDISLLDEEKDISSYCKESIEILPLQFGDFGEISKLDENNNELWIYITVNENTNHNVDSITKSFPNWYSILAIRMFGRFGLLCNMTQDIIRTKTQVKILLYGKDSKQTANACINASTFQNMFAIGHSNIEWLNNCVLYENLNLPQQLNEWLTYGTRRIEQNYLVLRLDIKGEYERFNTDAEKLKRHDISLLEDPDNPNRDYIWLCERCNYGLKEEYYLVNSKDTVTITYSPKEIKELIKQF